MSNAHHANPADLPKFNHEASQSPDYQVALQLAGKALELADAHRTPPVPKTYGVWYSYAAGKDRQINKRINSLIEEGKTLDTYDIGQIHDELVSSSQKDLSLQENASALLDREMAEIIKFVQSHVDSGKNFSGSLSQTIEALADARKPEQVRKTIEFLIDENEKMRAETAALTNSLEQSNTQIQKMRDNLAEARENEMRDPLTCLGNRRQFDFRLRQEIEEARESDSALSLVMADMDHFKRINDTFGHTIGDEVLKYFATLLADNVKGRDTAARYGGEEFVVILPDTSVSNARALIEQIRGKLETANLMITKHKRPLGKITASFGVARFSENDSSQDLIERADANLYAAKSAGRNCIVCDGDAEG